MKYITILVMLIVIMLNSATFISLNDIKSYDFIENLDNSGKISIKFTGTKPYRTDEIYKLLKEIKNKDSNINKFIEYFEDRYIDNDQRFVSYSDDKFQGGADPVLEQGIVYQSQINGKNETHANETEAGFIANISYKDFISIYSRTTVKYNHEGNPLRDEYSNPLIFTHNVNSFSSEDYSETVFMMYNDDMDISIGKFPFSEGTGYLNTLTLNKLRSYYDMFLFNFKYSDLKFTAAAGFLLPDDSTSYELPRQDITNGEPTYRKYSRREKYLASHRLEWAVTDNFSLAINENLIYGDRGVELGYLFPIMPLKWMEHYYGDNDNSTMSFDFKYQFLKDYSVYGELFIDDETWQKSLTEYYGNKWAILAGLYNSNFLSVPYLNSRFEFTRVEPWVYTHKFHINRYMNANSYLGSEFGPDSESYRFMFDYTTHFGLILKAGFTRANVGQPIVGQEDEQINYMDYPDVKKSFLNGVVEHHNYYTFEADYRYNRFIDINLYYSHRDIKNYEHKKTEFYSNNSVGFKVKMIIDRFDRYLF
ncbi:MAG: hypothetical protein JXR48_04290 [Candidatus Delongbacteria bacterium]|nr:hypothetical protein [Candidatus Delongbacteria bacterium]MBN2834166.1 hypothetical protein [Candidatus Delongbacteria bacterium]